MKQILITICLCLLIGCDKEKNIDNTNNKTSIIFDPYIPADSIAILKYHLDTISYSQIDLSTYLKIKDIGISGSEPIVVWTLFIEMNSDAGGFLQLSISAPNNSQDSLYHLGNHYASGTWYDRIAYYSNDKTYELFNLKPDDICINLQEFKTDSFEYKAKGYIELKNRLYWKWPAGVQTKQSGDSIIYPGDSRYYDYCKQFFPNSHPFYFSPVKIYFNNISK